MLWPSGAGGVGGRGPPLPMRQGRQRSRLSSVGSGDTHACSQYRGGLTAREPQVLTCSLNPAQTWKESARLRSGFLEVLEAAGPAPPLFGFSLPGGCRSCWAP